MHKVFLFAGLLALMGAASTYGCSSSSGNHPPVLNGMGGVGYGGSSGSSGSSGGAASSSSGSGSGSSSGSDASGGSSGSSSGGDGGADSGCATDDACNTLSLCGAQIPITATTGNFPAPAGGAIVPGTYVLTAIDDYSGGSTDGGTTGSQRQTILLATSTADGGPLPDAGSFTQNLAYDTVKDSDTAAVKTLEGVFSTGGTGYSITYSCPSGALGENGGYTATSTTLSIMAQPLVFTYAKQ